MSKMHWCIVLYCIFVSSTSIAASWRGTNEGMSFYSDMGFIEEEGEYSGHQIIIMPYNPYHDSLKYKVLWRSGNGYLSEPLLLDGVVQDDTITIIIPSGNEESGKWKLRIKGDDLLAEGPPGHSYTLHNVKLK